MLGVGPDAQARPDDICAILNAQGETIVEDGLTLNFLTHAGAFGAGPGPDNLIEGSFDLGLASSGGAINSANDDVADPVNDMDTSMPDGGGHAPMGWDESGPDASDVLVQSGGVNGVDPYEQRTINVRACDDAPIPAGACVTPHGAFSHSQLFVLRCDDGTTPCRGTPGRVSGDCATIGTEVCNKAFIRQGYVSGELSAISLGVQSNELVGEGSNATGALTPGALAPGTEPQWFDAYLVGAGPDARIRTDDDNTAECVDSGFPGGQNNGVAPGEDGMSAWITSVSTDLPLVAASNRVFWRLGEVRPNTPRARILRFTGDLMLKIPEGAGPTSGLFNAAQTWDIGWMMPFAEALALTQDGNFPNGNLPDLVLDGRGQDGLLAGEGVCGGAATNAGARCLSDQGCFGDVCVVADNQDAVLLPGTGLAQYMNQVATQIVTSGGFDKNSELLLAYFTVYVEVNNLTCAGVGIPVAAGEICYFQQYLVASGGILRIDVCGFDEDDQTGCPAGTPEMVGGRCEYPVGDHEFCSSKNECDDADAPPGELNRCIPVPQVAGGGNLDTVIAGSDGNP